MSLHLHAPAAGFVEPRCVGDVIALYLADARNKLAPLTYDGRKQVLDDFAAGFGAVPLTEGKPYHLQLWLNAHPEWRSNWTRKRCVAGVQAAINWAVKLGLIAANPFRGMSCPAGERGTPMDEDEFQAMLRHSPAPFRRFLIALRFSGARPGELASATWADVDLGRCCIELRKHKTSGKTGKPRRIILHPVVLGLLRWLRPRSLSALIFVNSKGGPWTRPGICWHIRELRRRGAIKADTTCYGLRHLACTQAVVAGVSFPVIAELMGHQRIETTMTYVHLSKQTGVLKQAIGEIFRKH